MSDLIAIAYDSVATAQDVAANAAAATQTRALELDDLVERRQDALGQASAGAPARLGARCGVG
jgi:uncharacterized membrane protein